jgi:hypothetical protein
VPGLFPPHAASIDNPAFAAMIPENTVAGVNKWPKPDIRAA